MTVNNPAALWLLPLLAVLVLLSRLRPEPVRRTIANLHLWAAAGADERSLASSSRPTFDPVLLLQIAFAVTIIAAVAHPLLPWVAREITIVIDTSASMAARTGTGSRIDAARARALALVDALPPSARVRLVGAGANATDMGTFGARDAGLRRAIAGMAAGPTGADIDDAIEAARTRDVTVISDLPSPPAPTDVHWVRVGEPADNLAVTALAARRASTGASTQLLAEVFNFGAAGRRVDMVFKRDDVEVSRTSLSIEPRHASTASISIPSTGGVYSAELVGNHDALALDDRRVIVVSPDRLIRVRVDATVSRFVVRALEANADVTVEQRGSTEPDVVVCGSCDTVPPGSASVLAVPDEKMTSSAPVPLTPVIPGHPLLQDLDFGLLRGRPIRSPSLVTDSAATTVLTAGDEGVLVAGEKDGRRIVQLKLKLDVEADSAGNIVFTPSFPILLANITGWLAAPRRAPEAVANVPTESESDLQTPTDLTGSPVHPGEEPHPADGVDPFSALMTLALAILLLEWWLTSRRRGTWDFTPWRVGAVALLVAAFLRIAIPAGREAVSLIAVLDRSDSVGSGAFRDGVARVNQLTAALREDDRLGIVVFGGDRAIERRLARSEGIGNVRSTVVGSGTNIEQALRLARRMLPDDGIRRIVLVSDGRETAGDARREAGRSGTAGVSIDVLPQYPGTVDQRSSLPRVVGVSSPAAIRENEPFNLVVRVDGSAGSRATVRVFRDGTMIESRDVRLDAAGAGVVTVSDTPVDAGRYVYTAAIDDDDDEPPGVVVTVGGQTRALYVGEPGPVAPAIASAGFSLTRTAVTNVPSSRRALDRYDLLVLDRNIDALSTAQSEAIAGYVENGGGLLVLGSATSLDAGALEGTPIEPVLPVDVRPRGGRRAPSTAFVFVFDKSGSMADRENGVQKIELARQAVLRVLSLQRSSDPFGVIAFDRAPVVVAPLARGHEASTIAERLRAIEPGGATAIAPALDMALGWLRSNASSKKHVLLVSDGRTTAGDAQRLRAAVPAGAVEVSTVAIGPDADQELLASLAGATGGRMYHAADVRDLPAIAARDAAAVSGGTAIDESFTVRIVAHPAMAGIDRENLPRLGGYVVTALKSGSEPMLLSHLDDPILAGWQRGLGRAAVFASDLRSPWAASMPAWDQFRRLWAQTARWAARGDSSGDLEVAETDRTGGPHLIINAERSGTFLTTLDLRAAVRDPSGTVTVVPVRATAPGRYEADMPAAAAGPYVVTISGRDTATGAWERAEHAFYWNANRERAVRGADGVMLSQIARLTGGRVLTPGENPLSGSRPWRYRDISSWLAAAALILFIADVARRRRAIAASARWWTMRGVETTRTVHA